MKCYIAVAVLAVVLSVAECALDRSKSIALLEKCKKETKATEDPETIFDKQTIPTTKEGKCMMACTLRGKGLMKDGKVSQQAVSDFFEQTYADNPEKLEHAAAAIGKCALVDVKGLDECETAYKYLDCGKKNGITL